MLLNRYTKKKFVNTFYHQQNIKNEIKKLKRKQI